VLPLLNNIPEENVENLNPQDHKKNIEVKMKDETVKTKTLTTDPTINVSKNANPEFA
jgi:hypothetical protein